MTAWMQFFYNFGHKIHDGSAPLTRIHAWLVYLALCLGIPLTVLAAVFGLTAAVLLPFALLFGWI